MDSSSDSLMETIWKKLMPQIEPKKFNPKKRLNTKEKSLRNFGLMDQLENALGMLDHAIVIVVAIMFD